MSRRLLKWELPARAPKGYTEAAAKAEVREALKDLERSALRLQIVQARLRALPAHRRVRAEWNAGNESAGSVAWWLAGSCWEVFDDLRENHIPNLRRDLRETDASCARRAKKLDDELKRKRKTTPSISSTPAPAHKSLKADLLRLAATSEALAAELRRALPLAPKAAKKRAAWLRRTPRGTAPS